jgi:hypothetical protein
MPEGRVLPFEGGTYAPLRGPPFGGSRRGVEGSASKVERGRKKKNRKNGAKMKSKENEKEKE